MIEAAPSVTERPRYRRGTRKVTLKRGPIFRPLVEDDLKYLGAAWKKGALDSMGGVFAEHDLSAQEFLQRAAEALADLPDGTGKWMLEAPVGGKLTPVGLMVAAVVEHRMEPNVYWFPWASMRNKLETVVKFINFMRRHYLVIVMHPVAMKPFFEAVARHGVLTRAGVIPGYYADADAMFWWSPRPKRGN